MKELDINKKQDVKYAIPSWVRDEQIRYAISKISARIEPIEGRIEDPIAIVGFGPSLQDTWEKIKDFKVIFTCSGAHKFLIEKGIIPTYHVEVDPRPHKVELLGTPQKDVQYLVASTCHPKYFEHLDGFDVKLWHVFDSTDEGVSILPPGEWAISGGCDVGMRCFTLAAFLGYRNFHVFGIDGCFRENNRHAGRHPNGKQEKYSVTFDGKQYETTPVMLESARQTIHELDSLPAVSVEFYGDGLTKEMYYKKEREPIDEKYKNVIAFQKPETITKEYADLNKKLHDTNPFYGIGGSKYADLVIQFCDALDTKSVLDYGCGKGHLAKNLPFPIWEYDPGVPNKNETPRPADIVICTDVLEHIEPDKLEDVLLDLRRCVKKVGYFVIHTGPSSKTLEDGRNTHLIQKDGKWWSTELEKHFLLGKMFMKGPEFHIVVGTKYNTNRLKIFIGWDEREKDAYNTAEYSIKNNCSDPHALDISPLKLSEIKKVFDRPIEWKGNQMWCPISNAPQTTEFSLSRFAIPFLSKGWALFVDSDIVCLGDITKIAKYADEKYAVMVVKHHQKVGENELKMVDQASVYYNRKNWSSVMLINCDHPAHKNLTIANLNNWPGRDLHAFKWLKDEEIGELPLEWNYLVDVSDPSEKENAKILHYTLGGPWIEGWASKESDKEWNRLYSQYKNN